MFCTLEIRGLAYFQNLNKSIEKEAKSRNVDLHLAWNELVKFLVWHCGKQMVNRPITSNLQLMAFAFVAFEKP
jgi:hypothetical protein